jgi:hypothetical protein
MAKLKATPKNFEQAMQVLNGKETVRLGNNTYLKKWIDAVSVRLHATDIVTFWVDGRVTLYTGGWRTVTTKDRINKFITGRVYQKNHEWFYVGHDSNGNLAWDNPVEFVEGMNVA